jgi:hypothetical protein
MAQELMEAAPEPAEAAIPEPVEAAQEIGETASQEEQISQEAEAALLKEAELLAQQAREEQLLEREVTLEPTEEQEAVLTSLTQEQKQIFTYFTLISGMEEQLCRALQGAKDRKAGSLTSRSGNLVISGGRGSGKTVLAMDFVKAFQKFSGKRGRKVGKISAASMNQKDVGKLFEAVDGGFLIIEKAGDLSRETVDAMTELMYQENGGVMVLLEDDRQGVEKALSRREEFSRMFTERIRIPVFTNDELVVFARSYAREHDCEIEDMGILALYNCISNIQKLDEATTLAEIKDIMDDAIESANRGGFKKLFGGKRTTQDGRVLIKEKDFA